MTLELYKQMHAAGHFVGHSTKKWSDDIAAALKESGSNTVLDYGAGKGQQYSVQKLHHEWRVEHPTLYDPAVPGHDKLPDGTFDAVLCVDVLEHLEGRELSDCILAAMSYADKMVFFAVTCRPAKKSLPDGRNCHITIAPPIWWRGYIQALCDRNGRQDLKVVLRFEE